MENRKPELAGRSHLSSTNKKNGYLGKMGENEQKFIETNNDETATQI
jgi:hypothetical protein